jgi:predicted CXXCH cytochrome family protein
VKQLHCTALSAGPFSPNQPQENTVKIIVSIAAALALVSAAPAFAAAPTAPQTLKGEKQPAVTFNHKTHASLDCTKCHADAKGGKIDGLVGNKDKGHGLCLECHKTQAKGPTKCAECHKKA